MASAGTLLTDLDGKPPIAGDNDLVNLIYKDMNTNSDSGMRPGGAIQMMPSQQTHHANQMDVVPPTAHVIGGQHPTAGDFAKMLQSSAQGYSSGGDSWAAAPNQMSQQELMAQLATMQNEKGKAWSGFLLEELKVPILIAVLVFLTNMQFVNVLMAHYASWMLETSGNMNLYGQLFKSLSVAGLFWGVQKIIIPFLR